MRHIVINGTTTSNTLWIYNSMTKIEHNHKKYIVKLCHDIKHSHVPIHYGFM